MTESLVRKNINYATIAETELPLETPRQIAVNLGYPVKRETNRSLVSRLDKAGIVKYRTWTGDNKNVLRAQYKATPAVIAVIHKFFSEIEKNPASYR